MAKPHKFYLRHMNKKTGYRAVWDPGKPLKIGFIGKLDRFGHFTVYSSLEAEGIIPEVLKDETPSEEDYSSTESVSIEVKASGAAPVAGSVLSAADAGFTISLKSDRSVVFKMNGYKTHQIINIANIERAVAEKFKNGNWEEDWYIVTELVEADQATIIISNSSNGKLELKAKADATTQNLTLTNAALGLSVAREQGSNLKFIAQQGLTPLYKIRGIRDPFADSIKLENKGEEPATKSYELREIEFNESEVEEEELITMNK